MPRIDQLRAGAHTRTRDLLRYFERLVEKNGRVRDAEAKEPVEAVRHWRQHFEIDVVARLMRRGSTPTLSLSVRHVRVPRQGGSSGTDYLYGSAWVDEGTVVLCGRTDGDWNVTNIGQEDFMAVGLDPSDGKELWLWQVRHARCRGALV